MEKWWANSSDLSITGSFVETNGDKYTVLDKFFTCQYKVRRNIKFLNLLFVCFYFLYCFNEIVYTDGKLN